MEEQKPKFDWKQLLIIVIAMLATAGVIGGGMYVLDGTHKKELETTRNALNQAVDSLKDVSQKKETKAPVVTAASPTFTDKDLLNLKTLNKSTYGNGKTTFVAPVINKNDGTWAVTSPIPVMYDSQAGYSVPGMGGTSYLWRKVSGEWQFVGQGGEGGWDDAVKAKFNVIPLTIITQEER